MHQAPPRDRRPAFDRTVDAPPAWRRAYGEGVYRRRVVVRVVDDTHATGDLEDDFHHFRVDLTHDGEVVTAVEGSGVRSPWTMCLTGGEPLQALVGHPLATGPAALSGLHAKQNCTHMFDLAGFVVAHAARGQPGDRVFDMVVDDPPPDGSPQQVILWRDGELVLRWEVRDREVLAPGEWVDAPLWSGFIPWAAANLDDDLAEAAVAMRRAITISMGRIQDLDHMETAEPLRPMMEGICHAMQPQHVALAIRHKGSARDFTDHPELLAADFDDRRR